MARLAYADPPYPGCAHRYPENEEVNQEALIQKLLTEYDGFVFHTHSPALRALAQLFPEDCRFMAWVKPFAAFKRNVPVAYAWEPVVVRTCRKPVVSHRIVMRDWVSESITLKKGLVGAKPEAVCLWAFEMMGAEPDDTLDDLYPGTGAVTRAWTKWQNLVRNGGENV